MYLGEIKVKEIKETKLAEFGNIYEMIIYGAINDCVIEVEGYVSYFRDIQVDYVNKEIYTLSFENDALIYDGRLVEYNNRFKKILIHSKDKYYTDKIGLIQDNTKYIVKTSQLGTQTDVNKEARDIYMRYIRQSYGRLKCNKDKYNRKLYYKSVNKDIIEKLGLTYYNEDIRKDYRDVRRWHLEELREKYTDAELGIGIDYDIKRLEFELELYLRLCDKEYWCNWKFSESETSDKWKGRNKDFKKYKEQGISLIYKRRWESV